MQAWRTLARPVQDLRAAPWSCRDTDDQKFLDLAFSAPAALLFTKDRALLDLARRARRQGLQILQPAGYATVAPPGS
jgi:predicted nucleic acid-binding protein